MIGITALIRRLSQIACIVLIDLIAFYISLSIVLFLRIKIITALIPNLPAFTFSNVYILWLPLIFLFFMFYEGLYGSNMPFWDETKNMVKAVSLSILTAMAIVTLGRLGDKVSRIALLGLWCSSLFLFPFFRLWGKKLLYHLGIWREKVLILGAGNSGRLVMEGLMREEHMGYDVIGFLDDDATKKGEIIEGKKVFGSVRHFPRFMKELAIRTVIIAMPSLPTGTLASLTAEVQKHAVHTMVIPDLKGIALLNTDLLHFFYEEIFLMNIKNNLKSSANRFIKRLFDLLLSLLSLLVVLPLVGIISLIIRLESKGDSIYVHERVGRHGEKFRCYKFRTMHKDAEKSLQEMLGKSDDLRTEWEKSWKLKDDPRITRVGRFLRRTSLDELPQIFNVIKGEMSLVGPRPVTHYEFKKYYSDVSEICFCVPPGITGLWQVSGRSTTDYDRRIKHDIWYVMNWSLWLDVVILCRTVRVVAKMEGAY